MVGKASHDPAGSGSATIVHNDGELTVMIDETVYSREAVLRACYWFTDRAYLFVSRPAPNRLAVAIRPKAAEVPVDTVAGDFCNALLDHQVRLDIQRETHTVRELIVAKAFAEGDLLDDAPVGDDRDPVETSQISVPTPVPKGS